MTTWVLLRGLTRESRHWGGFVPALREALPGAEVVTLDLPGNGTANALRSPTRIEAMADFCHDEMQRRGVAPPHFVIGLSMGGMVALAWAAQHPADLRGAVLVNTSLRPFSPFWHRLKPACWPTLAALAVMPLSLQAREAAVLRLTSRHEPARALLDAWVAWRRERPVAPGNALRQLVAAARYRAPRAAPPLPLLVLASERDGLVDVRCSQALAAAWSSPLALHPSAGHDLPLDDPRWVAARVGGWADGGGNTHLR